MLTDVLDGYLARKLNVVSVLGKLIDPLADKLIVMAALVWLVPMGRIPAWAVVILLARVDLVQPVELGERRDRVGERG